MTPAEFWELEYWEFEECWQGYVEREKRKDLRLFRQLAWSGKLGKHPKFEKVFSYDYITGEEKTVTKESVKRTKEKYNKAWGVMTTERFFHLKRLVGKRKK